LNPLNGTATGGDVDVARSLHLLARRRPQDTFYLLGRNSGDDPQQAGYPSNVINPWFDSWKSKVKIAGLNGQGPETVQALIELTMPAFLAMDAMIVWSGQHGTSNMSIPTLKNRMDFTAPQVNFVNYASFIIAGVNAWRDQSPTEYEEIWLCPDPRNYLKARDVKWPLLHPIIAQYEQARTTKHERFGDPTEPTIDPWHSTCRTKWSPNEPGVWTARTRYAYDALELTALPLPRQLGPIAPHDQRFSFGALVNENRTYVAKNRHDAVRDWILRRWPDAEIFGKWSAASLESLGRPDIRIAPYEHIPQVLQRWRSTLTTPASGTGWATAKPWECFAHGVVCYFHPAYDTQGHILKDAPAELRQFLRVATPDELWRRVDGLDRDPVAWRWVIDQQREYFLAKYEEHHGGLLAIERRLDAT
jgi:hypothetical protein